MLGIWAVWVKWEYCMRGSTLFFSQGAAESGHFHPLVLCRTWVGVNQWCLLASTYPFAWLVDCAEPIGALGLVTHILVLWVAPSKTLGRWAYEQTFFLTLAKLGTRGFLSDCMTVLWGRVSGERVP